MEKRRTTTLHRFVWQAGGEVAGRAASLVSLVVAARVLGLGEYGRFVVLLALLEGAMVPWKATVLQAAAALQAREADGGGWAATTARWWVLGTLVLGPAAFLFDGVRGMGVLLAASAATALMFAPVPGLFLAGRQRRFAIGHTCSQVARLGFTVALGAAGWLTPRTALLAVAGGSLVGAIALWNRNARFGGRARWLGREVATEALRWGEVHAPILVVAMLLGLSSAGGFDLAYKTIQAAAQLLGGIGVIMLPAFVRGEEPPSDVIARSLRLPTALGVGLALAAGVGLGPLLELLTGTELGLGAAPAAFVPVLLLAPWMGVSWTALVVLGGERWLIPSQVSVSAVTVAASFLAAGGVWWAAVAVSAAHLMGSVVRWRGVRALGHLPPPGWMSVGDWRRDLAWLGDAARRRA